MCQLVPQWPFWLRLSLETVDLLRRLLTNISWSSAEQVVRMGVGLVISVSLARYFGPEQFGAYSFIITTVAIATAVVPLACDQIVQRDLIERPEAEGATLGAAAVLRLLGGAFAVVAGVLAVQELRSGRHVDFMIALLAGLPALLMPAEIITVWFGSRLQLKSAFVAKVPPLLAMAVLRGVMILLGAPLAAFLGVFVLENALTAVALWLVYRGQGQWISSWRFSSSRAVQMCQDSLPLLLAQLATLLYLRVDVLILGLLKGDDAVGVYGAATRLSMVWYAIPMIVSASLQPALFSLRAADAVQYEGARRVVYASMAWSGYAIALATCLIATPLCTVLFGASYRSSGFILAIHIWSIIPVFLSVASNCFLVAENQVWVAMYRTVFGLMASIVANLLLVPPFGAVGAAIATLFSYTVATFSISVFKGTRHDGVAMLRALSPLGLCDLVGWWLAKRRNYHSVRGMT